MSMPIESAIKDPRRIRISSSHLSKEHRALCAPFNFGSGNIEELAIWKTKVDGNKNPDLFIRRYPHKLNDQISLTKLDYQAHSPKGLVTHSSESHLKQLQVKSTLGLTRLPVRVLEELPQLKEKRSKYATKKPTGKVYLAPLSPTKRAITSPNRSMNASGSFRSPTRGGLR